MRLKLLLIYISIIAFVIPTLYAPSLVDVGVFFDATSAEAKRTATFYQIGILLSSIIIGLFSDSFGKKNLLQFSLGLTALGSLISGISPSIEFLTIGRFTQGVGANTGVLLGFALVVQSFDQKTSVGVFSLLGFISGLALATAPVLGELLTSSLGWRAVSVLFFMVSIFLLIESHLILDRKINKIEKTKFSLSITNFISLIKNRTYLSYVLVAPTMIGGLWFSFSFMPFYLEQHLGYDGSYFGFLVAVMMLFYGTGNYIPQLLQGRFSNDSIILMGIHLSGASILLILVSIFFNINPGPMVGLCLVLFSISLGIASPISITVAMSVNIDLAVKSAALRALVLAVINSLSAAAAEASDDSNIWYLVGFLITSYVTTLIVFLLRKPYSNA